MVKLIRGLIDSGALKKDVGEALLAQAQTEHIAAQQALRQAAAPVASAQPKVEPGDVRVPYVSQAVRDKIRDEVKGQIMAQARSEGWAAPNETPEWTKRIRVEGDVRLRNESRFYSDSNDNLGMVDWAAINNGNAYDINPNSNTVLPPQLNTRQDRKNQWKARARLGVIADITEQTSAGVRLATGNDDSPVSTTQTLGGGLEKKSVWLDQAWFSHQPADWLKITGGRFGNPFYSTDILFSNDLNFDGLAAQFNRKLSNERVSLFGTIGVIPLEYSSDKFPGNKGDKMSSETKWLLGAQVGANWKLDQTNSFRGAAAYYEFKNVAGKLSDPCYLYSGQDTACSTDWTRPAFMQRGNTLMLLRNIALNPLDPASTAQPQYLGLASKFRLLDLNARWETRIMNGYPLRLDANYIRNLDYDADEMFARANGGIVNNFDGSGGTDRSAFRSGGNAYMLQATFGKPAPSEKGEWNMMASYKYIEADSMPDGYNDSSFHLGGTNARGYTLGTTYAFDKNTTLSGRWMSSKEVHGQPYAIDLLQLELNTRF
ncbi:hypothetical protein GCM10007205_00990 [Oxalicibacterium flavum]|uniref:Porin n=2 Tax=Oxalicibacterium flavum TaxID=179467 RepID=A0A8J2XUL4_9BURK|nr:hypothetical protein GCM10007205_00990 [Oxalicibacterium flavum]